MGRRTFVKIRFDQPGQTLVASSPSSGVEGITGEGTEKGRRSSSKTRPVFAINRRQFHQICDCQQHRGARFLKCLAGQPGPGRGSSLRSCWFSLSQTRKACRRQQAAFQPPAGQRGIHGWVPGVCHRLSIRNLNRCHGEQEMVLVFAAASLLSERMAWC